MKWNRIKNITRVKSDQTFKIESNQIKKQNQNKKKQKQKSSLEPMNRNQHQTTTLNLTEAFVFWTEKPWLVLSVLNSALN